MKNTLIGITVRAGAGKDAVDYQVGTSSRYDVEYASGPSRWLPGSVKRSLNTKIVYSPNREKLGRIAPALTSRSL